VNIHSQPEIPYFPTWLLRQMLCLPIVIFLARNLWLALPPIIRRRQRREDRVAFDTQITNN